MSNLSQCGLHIETKNEQRRRHMEKNSGLFPSPREYRCRLFQIGDTLCSWQLMWDCARKQYVCIRNVSDFFNAEARKRYEKQVYVQCPKMTAGEKAAADNLFKMIKTSKAHQEQVIHILLKDRWQKAAEEMCEKLAKSDWERYGKKGLSL